MTGRHRLVMSELAAFALLAAVVLPLADGAAADMVVPKPASLTFERAAAVPIAATTALRGIRDVGEAKAGQLVLVNGAGGGVGT